MRVLNCGKRKDARRSARFLAIPAIFFLAGIAQADHNTSHFCKTNIPGAVANRFVDNGNGTVTDKITRLTWQRCDVSMSWQATGSTCVSLLVGGHKDFTWKDALNEVVTFNQTETLAGHPADWRIPNIKELATIANMNCVYKAIDTIAFPEAYSEYWSSTPVVQVDVDSTVPNRRQNGAWTFDFDRAREGTLALGDVATLRLVRQ